jgi:SAM-dependent methyltransferase
VENPGALASVITLDWPTVTDPDGYFGEQVATAYDQSDDEAFEPARIEATVAFLASLAGGGPVLELAIGTGRIALPLAARGLPVHGIELSAAMVARLRAKPGGDRIGVTVGDMTTTTVPGPFTLVFLVFNTISNLTTQDGQVDCFANAAAHLAPGGRFVIEVGVPDLRRLPPGQNAVPFDVRASHLGFDVYDDLASQSFSSHHVTFRDGRPEYTVVPFRYVWPAELDLMARLAGLRLEQRWAGWNQEPFTGECRSHVSVWVKP